MPIQEKPGYGARVCLFNASGTEIPVFSLSGNGIVSGPALEIRSIPAESVTRFMNVVPGPAVPVVSAAGTASPTVALHTAGKPSAIHLEDHSYHLFLVSDTGRGPEIDHYALTE